VTGATSYPKLLTGESLSTDGHKISYNRWKDGYHLLYNTLRMKVLVIEDEEKVASFIKRGLEEEDYTPTVAYNGRMGLDLLKQSNYDIVLLDLMIPEVSGLDLLKDIRSRGITTPVLIITAMSSKEDVVTGLDLGSDDYLTKPFSFDELLARMRALLRRSKTFDTHILEYRSLTLDPYRRKLCIGTREVDLTDREFLTMECLVKNSERPVTRKDISEYVWQSHSESTNIVDVYINFLRRKIESLSPKRYIHTVRGVGYILREDDENG
jgi:DNA-binding response OmpR family regulator